MQYISHYSSPLGSILLAADGIGLTGLWFEGQKYFACCLDREHTEKEIPLFEMTRRWLDLYFSGREPDFSVPLHAAGTAFQKEVWEILCSIPYGRTMTYGGIARQLAAKRGVPRMSRPGRWRRSGTQSYLHPCALSPCGGRKRKPDRIRRRHRQENKTADFGEGRYEPFFHS